MKITIYELLGLAKDGKVPQKIKYEYSIYELTPEMNDYYCKNEMRWFTNEINSLGVLNDYVEIIEEPKKIEKIEMVGCNVRVPVLNNELVGTDTPLALETTIVKINEIIDEINNLKEK